MPNENMKVITVMTRKGGAGKTMLTRALASAAMNAGKKCLVLDADPQQALFRWAEKLKIEDPNFTIEELKSPEAFEARVDAAWEEGSTDFVFVDTLGAAGAWADDLAAFSDILVVPMMLSNDDMEITQDTHKWYVDLRGRTEDPENLPTFHVVLSSVPARMSKTEQQLELEAIQSFPVVQNYFMERKQHKDAASLGFLHYLAEARRNDPNPLLRTHAKHYEEALDEALAILQDIGGIA